MFFLRSNALAGNHSVIEVKGNWPKGFSFGQQVGYLEQDAALGFRLGYWNMLDTLNMKGRRLGTTDVIALNESEVKRRVCVVVLDEDNPEISRSFHRHRGCCFTLPFAAFCLIFQGCQILLYLKRKLKDQTFWLTLNFS